MEILHTMVYYQTSNKAYLWAVPLGYSEKGFQASMIINFTWKKFINLGKS